MGRKLKGFGTRRADEACRRVKVLRARAMESERSAFGSGQSGRAAAWPTLVELAGAGARTGLK